MVYKNSILIYLALYVELIKQNYLTVHILTVSWCKVFLLDRIFYLYSVAKMDKM